MSWRSFITPLTLYRKKTAHGTLLEVSELYGQRQLYLDGHPQSTRSYRHDWKKIFRKSRVPTLPKQGSALVLGLGGGDMAHMLEQMQSSWHITFVELEREVVEAARLFGVNSTEKRTILVQDAKSYVAKHKVTHDLVVVDLYSGDDVPSFVTTAAFLRGISRSLKPTGRAIFNYASHSFEEKDFRSFELALRRVFTHVLMLKTWGHTFYLAY